MLRADGTEWSRPARLQDGERSWKGAAVVAVVAVVVVVVVVDIKLHTTRCNGLWGELFKQGLEYKRSAERHR